MSRVTKRRIRIAAGVCLFASTAIAVWLLPSGHEPPPYAFPAPQPRGIWHTDEEGRMLALRLARVWTPVDVTAFDFAANPPDSSGTLSDTIVRCQYRDEPAHGTTPKFDCVLRDGEVVKVKYGHTGEIPAEIAASRLLAGLGFGADRMYLMPRVRCYRCARTPFYLNWVLDHVHARELVERTIPEDRYTDFEWVAVERHFDGLPIEAGAESGWAWWELANVDASGAPNRAERDALRLMAIFLVHWDNKASNQRLVCQVPTVAGAEHDGEGAAGPCPRSFALIHDLGATFGPNKMEIDPWKAAPIWTDAARCMVSMRQFPHHGGTFPDAQISEAGRQLLSRQLTALSERQVVALFTAARFAEFFGGRGEGADINAWVRVFHDKVRQIVDRGPCPS
jgi:hypothetical protein